MARAANIRIKIALLEVGMKNWELAAFLGISEATMSRRLRVELPEEEQDRIINVIRNNANTEE